MIEVAVAGDHRYLDEQIAESAHGSSQRRTHILQCAARKRWRSDDNANEFGFTGTFREVQPASKIVHTEAYDAGTLGGGYPGNDAIVTVTFTEESGVTTVTTLIDFGSKEARDAAIATGMTDGMEQSYQLLDRLLKEQPQA